MVVRRVDLTAAKNSIVAEYVEVEGGKRSDPPQLSEAIAHAHRDGARLIIAKLDGSLDAALQSPFDTFLDRA